MELRGKNVMVVGLAQTGVALARFCARRGAKVTVTDAKPAEKLASSMAQLAEVPVTWELGGHQEQSFTSADLVVVSPGVPDLAEMKAARAAGVPVWAEIELAYRYLHPGAKLVAITGTNGKSTTTALTGELCRHSARPTFCGGNLGNMPLIDAVDHPANVEGGLIVAEVAAFMLEHCVTFRGDVGVLTNVTEDHLDRFGTMAKYAEMKGRIWDWQRAEDVAVANADDAWTMRETADIPSQLFTFDSRRGARCERGAVVSEDRQELVLRVPARWSGGGAEIVSERYPVSDLVIIGNHNLENAMGAYLSARAIGVPPEAIRRGAAAYRPLPHRMELVGDLGGIVYYDDSKGTNVASVAASVRGFPRPLILIAGGVDKGGSYLPMLEALDEMCKGMVLIGKAAPLIREAAAQHGVRYPVVDAGDMHDAVRRATDLATPGDAVVLSPACSSYDMFKNFEHRGHTFRTAVSSLGATRLDH